MNTKGSAIHTDNINIMYNTHVKYSSVFNIEHVFYRNEMGRREGLNVIDVHEE